MTDLTLQEFKQARGKKLGNLLKEESRKMYGLASPRKKVRAPLHEHAAPNGHRLLLIFSASLRKVLRSHPSR